MAELLKNIYNTAFFDRFTSAVLEVKPDFNKKAFLRDIYDKTWKEKELKQRMRHITLTLRNHLSGDFSKNIKLIIKLIPVLKRIGFKPDSLEFIFLPDFIEVYGMDEYDRSVKSLESITQFVTCEYAVRPFLIRYPKQMMEQMLLWSNHKHPMVRRLATEGCRPRLPWAMGIPDLKKNPKPIFPILENLKKDPSESVRRSVANNLNDISRDHPTTIISIVKKWQGQTTETDALTKHACRTLLKQGNPAAMKMFGLGASEKFKLSGFTILTPKVKIGSYLEFSFELLNLDRKPALIRLEYAIYYQKANGTLSKKVYKISEKEYPKSSNTPISRKQSFKIITTRKLHPGLHQIAVILNGKEFETHDFKLAHA